MRTQVQFVTVAQSAQASGTFSLLGVDKAALWAPTVTSGEAVLQGAFDTTSANFVPLGNPDGTGTFTLSFGAGSAMLDVSDVIAGVPHGRIDLGVPQTDVRTLAIVTKP